MDLTLDSVPVKSENVVSRKIENEYILVPIVASAADVESIFNLNDTGAAVWERIDGTKRLSDIIEDIKSEYESDGNLIESDVMAFINEMMEAKLIRV